MYLYRFILYIQCNFIDMHRLISIVILVQHLQSIFLICLDPIMIEDETSVNEIKPHPIPAIFFLTVSIIFYVEEIELVSYELKVLEIEEKKYSLQIDVAKIG